MSTSDTPQDEPELSAFSSLCSSQCHERANHEDMLHCERSSALIQFNIFFVFAVLLHAAPVYRLALAVFALIVDISWILWAREVAGFIRALREANKGRADERVWQKVIGAKKAQRRWRIGPLTIFGNVMPALFALGWFVVLLFLFLSMMHMLPD